MREDSMLAKAQYKIFSLPYAVKDSDFENEVPPEVEVASIFVLAFCRRRKRGILIGKSESLEAISRIYYPLIYAPCEEKAIIMDGLGFSHIKISESSIPDATTFIERLRESRVSLDSFIETLNMGVELFSKPLNGVEWRLEYLIGEPELVKALSSLTNMLKPIEDPNFPIISPRFSVNDAYEIVKRISEEKRRLKIEVSMLRYVLQALSREVNHHMEKLARESEQILREYKRRIAEIEGKVDETIKRLIREKEREEKRIRSIYDRKRKAILREIDKINGAILKVEILLEKSRGRRAGCRGKRESKIEFYERKVSELRKSINNLHRDEEEIRREEEEKIREIEEKYNALISSEGEKLEVLRESRDAEMARVNEVSNKIKAAHSSLMKRIEQLIEEKRLLIETIEGYMLPSKLEETVLVGVPLYVAKYESRGEFRFDVYPPARAISLAKALQTIEGDFSGLSLERRLTLFLSPLSENLSNIISKVFSKYISEDKRLNENVRRMVEERNILKLSGIRETLRNGLDELESEGWINSQEKDELLKYLESQQKEINF